MDCKIISLVEMRCAFVQVPSEVESGIVSFRAGAGGCRWVQVGRGCAELRAPCLRSPDAVASGVRHENAPSVTTRPTHMYNLGACAP